MSSWQTWLRLIVVGVPVVGATPTALTAYQSFKHGIPYGEVSHRLSQWELWNKNAACAAKLDYREVDTDRAKINVAICKETGDIAIRIAAPDGRSINEWIAFDRLDRTAKPYSVWDLLFSTVRASPAVPRMPAAKFRFAQRAGLQVICQSTVDKTKIVRIVNESGRCYRETFSPFQGRVEKREEVPCNTSCPAPRR